MDLQPKINELAEILPQFEERLNKAYEYVKSDPNSSLMKTRVILEMVVIDLWLKLTDHKNKRELSAMISDRQFGKKVERRILARMHSIRAMSNLGVHGENVYCR